MNLPDDNKQREATLRAAADGQLATAAQTSTPVRPAEELLLELQVHQIELEMQNEALRQAQMALAESRDRYVDLYEFAPVGYLTLTAQGMIAEVNLTGTTLLGQERSKLLHKRFASFVVPEDQDRWIQLFLSVKQSDGHRKGELALQRGDGTVFQAQLDCVRFEGSIPEVRIALSDISETKRAEEALRESTALIESVVENIPLMIFLKEATDLRFVIFNRAGEELLGYDRKDLLGKNNLDLFPPEQAAHFMAKDREVLDGEMSFLDIPEEGILTATKGERLLHTRKVCIRGSDGKTKYLLGISEDITERKQAEQTQAMLAAIVESSSEAIIGRALDNTIVSWNAAAERMFGYTADEAIGRDALGLIMPPELRQEALARRKLREAGHTLAERDTVHIAKDGRRIDVAVVACTIKDKEGRVIGFATMLRDISERKRAEARNAELEAQLRESQKMEALGTLAGGVAHDFNNVLAMITGNAELARQDVGPGHAALVSLDEIGKASRRAKNLVQQILAFGRRQKLERKPTALALVVVETERMLRASLPAMVSLAVECKADAPAVLADATQVKQILLNLCGNALQAVQDEERAGVIEICLQAHRQNEARGHLRPGRYACLSVRDNGPGMDEATRSRIFEPFFTTKPKGKGTGLGLAVVHGLVQAHEASMEVESAPGEGSAFRIYFPATEECVPELTVPTPGAAPVHGKGKHILYVDDEEAIIFLMTRLLERQGFRVSGYTDPREALAAARANTDQFDLVVTDYNMPGMSGLQVASALREIRADLPVVLASGYITEELRAKAPAAGIRELIYKPNTVDDLCEAVARYARALSGT